MIKDIDTYLRGLINWDFARKCFEHGFFFKEFFKEFFAQLGQNYQIALRRVHFILFKPLLVVMDRDCYGK